jgi:hypothetical protein
MKWKREQPGLYTAGPYRVERGPYHRAIWSASGPGVSTGSEVVNTEESKELAQARCFVALIDRVGDTGQLGRTCSAVVGDCVQVLENARKDRRGRITTIIDNTVPGRTAEPIYCVRFNVGGGRTCLFRHEFEVIAP